MAGISPEVREKIIAEALGRYRVLGHQYPQPLPPALAAWYCYTSDGGHSILAGLVGRFDPADDPADQLVPVPVRTVLRGYTERDGFVLVDLPYDAEIGLQTPAGDDEF